MELVYRRFDREEWGNLTASLWPPSAPQMWEWAEAKAMTGPWQPERCVIVDAGRVIGAAQAVARRLPLGRAGLVFINRGPLTHRSSNSNLVMRLTSLLKRHWVDDRRMVLRVALPARVDSFNAAALEEFHTSSAGWSSMELDLAQSHDDLRAGMKQKWRNCLYKAERLGTQVRVESEPAIFERFTHAYDRALRLKGIVKSTSPEFLQALQTLLPEDRKMLVLEAVHEGQPVAWALLVSYLDRSEYIAATSLPMARPLNTGQLLMWRAVCEAQRRGSRVFDLGGIGDSVEDAGVAHFKAGLGGTRYRLVPELEAHARNLTSQLVRWRAARARRTATGTPAAGRTP